jgi:hypothetical protein
MTESTVSDRTSALFAEQITTVVFKPNLLSSAQRF